MLLINQAIQLIQKEYNPIAKDIRQPCNYCGYGYYVEYIQTFRIEKADNREWWE